MRKFLAWLWQPIEWLPTVEQDNDIFLDRDMYIPLTYTPADLYWFADPPPETSIASLARMVS